MTTAVSTTAQTRRAYDHRLREHVLRCGAAAVAKHVQIPRSTVSTWRRRGLRPVVTTDPFGQDLQLALDSRRPLADTGSRARRCRSTPSRLAPGFCLSPRWVSSSGRKGKGWNPSRHRQRRRLPSVGHYPAHRPPGARSLPRLAAGGKCVCAHRQVVLSAHEPWPAYRNRSGHYQRHGAGIRLPPHAARHPCSICPAHRQGLRIRHHVGQTRP